MLILVLRDQSLSWAGTVLLSVNATYLMCLCPLKCWVDDLKGSVTSGPGDCADHWAVERLGLARLQVSLVLAGP